jgi:hypothetical protein
MAAGIIPIIPDAVDEPLRGSRKYDVLRPVNANSIGGASARIFVQSAEVRVSIVLGPYLNQWILVEVLLEVSDGIGGNN